MELAGCTDGEPRYSATGSEDKDIRVCAHGTDIAAALSILSDGHIRPSPGIAGLGVYTIPVKDRASETSPANHGQAQLNHGNLVDYCNQI